MRLGPAAALAALLASPAVAGTQHILVGLDETMRFGVGGEENHPGADAVLVLDASNPAHPKFGAPIPMSNSALGPPVNLQITPDGSLGLVASARKPLAEGATGTPDTDNRVHVIDLSTMTLLGDVTVAEQPQGIAISHDGKLALVTSRLSKDVSVLTLDGKTVKETGRVTFGDVTIAAAIVPDGTRAFVIKNGSSKVGVLSIAGGHITYDSAFDIPVGFNPYNIALTPDGALGLVVNNGIHGNAASLTVFDARGPHPHVVDTLALGDGPEGFAMAPDGKSATVLLLHGSTSAHDDWSYHPHGGAVLLSIRNGRVKLLPGEVPLGAVPEGVAYSRDSHYVYAADFTDKLLHILQVTPKGLKQTGTLALPGHPASMRGPAF